jgi:penicillin-binding protein-related factor A (putative recombinase)
MGDMDLFDTANYDKPEPASAPGEQADLPGMKTKKGNVKGFDFEAHLDSLHKFYLIQGLICVNKNTETWTFEYGKQDNFEAKWKAGSDTVAKTAGGKRLLKVYSLPDYTGTNGSFGIMFDAKATAGDSIPLANLKTTKGGASHQIHNLKQAAKCGALAGFLILFYEHKRCFWAPVKFVDWKEQQYLRASSAKGKRAKPGTASISIAELEANGIEIPKNKINLTWDWFAVLAQPALPGKR